MWNRKITIDGGMGTELVRCGATEVFLDEKKFQIFTPKILLHPDERPTQLRIPNFFCIKMFYTKIFGFFTPKFVDFFTPKFFVFLHQILKFRKIFFGNNWCKKAKHWCKKIFCKKIWCKKIGVKKRYTPKF